MPTSKILLRLQSVVTDKRLRWAHDPQLWVELFVTINLAILAADIDIAHSVNHFQRGAEYIPLYFSIGAPAVLAVVIVLRRTTFGLDLRTVIENREVAELLGIDTKRVFTIAFCAGTALAGLAGALVAPLAKVVVSMGANYLAPSFFVVIVGGAGVAIFSFSSATTTAEVSRPCSSICCIFAMALLSARGNTGCISPSFAPSSSCPHFKSESGNLRMSPSPNCTQIFALAFGMIGCASAVTMRRASALV